ncbi:CaaX protease [Cercophora scortea]|uniref:intramembrane prenyl-peptidase Rce1 n=1 Tax=Cercophora scortea TaxID=314031 RepID=A0AAE0MHY9_9PEZI|nr:CaaX protease [Cercophora scortea]
MSKSDDSLRSLFKAGISSHPTNPPLTTTTASLLIALYALVYFVPFYFSRTARPSPTLSRDTPSVIRARIGSVTVSCAVCCATTYLVLTQTGSAPASTSKVLHLMGIWPPALADSARAVLLTALLFLGPLYSYLIVDDGWRSWLALEPLRELWEEWTVWRNYVAGPITEEILYRSASIPLMLAAQAPVKETILLSPFLFGLSHFHHFYEFRLTHPQVPIAAAVARSLFQLTYTTLFGAYATFLFVRTGSLPAVCAVHAFCNAMGLPRLWGRVRRPWEWEESAVGGQRSSSVLWSVGYYVLLVVGAVSWYRNLWALTQSGNALISPEAFLSM